MKVKDLIEQLRKQDINSEVYVALGGTHSPELANKVTKVNEESGKYVIVSSKPKTKV